MVNTYYTIEYTIWVEHGKNTKWAVRDQSSVYRFIYVIDIYYMDKRILSSCFEKPATPI